MISFREKVYSSKTSSAKKVVRYLKKYPLIPLSTASLGVASANYSYNKKKTQEDLSLQKKQLKAMEELTAALTDTTVALEKEEKARKKEIQERKKEKEEEKKKKKSPFFKPKKGKKK